MDLKHIYYYFKSIISPEDCKKIKFKNKNANLIKLYFWQLILCFIRLKIFKEINQYLDNVEGVFNMELPAC